MRNKINKFFKTTFVTTLLSLPLFGISAKVIKKAGSIHLAMAADEVKKGDK